MTKKTKIKVLIILAKFKQTFICKQYLLVSMGLKFINKQLYKFFKSFNKTLLNSYHNVGEKDSTKKFTFIYILLKQANNILKLKIIK